MTLFMIGVFGGVLAIGMWLLVEPYVEQQSAIPQEPSRAAAPKSQDGMTQPIQSTSASVTPPTSAGSVNPPPPASPPSAAYPARRPEAPVQRTLQVAQLAAVMKPFDGIFLRIENDTGDEIFAESLRATLRLAGCRTNSGDVVVDPQRFAFDGIKVLIQEAPLSETDRAPAAAEALVKELQRQNFLARKLPSDTATQANFIRIRIGTR